MTHYDSGADDVMQVNGVGRMTLNTSAVDGFRLIGRNTGDSGDVNITGTARLWGYPKA